MTCSRQDECKSTVGCKGCGFKHFDKIESKDNQAIEFIKDEYFNLCLQRRKGPGGRVSLDAPFKKFILEEAEAERIIPDFPYLKALEHSELTDKIIINGEECKFRIKCDGAFSFSSPGKHKKYIFVEIKGGDDTNSILSAITAAQLSSQVEKFKNHKYHKYYYLGSTSAKTKKSLQTGLKRKDLLVANRYKVASYIKWAESKGFIKFYGILDLEEMLKDIKDYCEQA